MSSVVGAVLPTGGSVLNVGVCSGAVVLEGKDSVDFLREPRRLAAARIASKTRSPGFVASEVTEGTCR